MKQFNSLLLVITTLFLTACASNGGRRAAPIQVNVPAGQAILVNITPEIASQYQQALALLKQQQLPAALKAFGSLAGTTPGIAGVHLNIALIHFQLGQFNFAREQVDKVIAVAPQNAIAYNLSGSLYRQQGQFKAARLAYAKALKMAPDYAMAHLNMAILFDIYFQYWQDAERHYRRYLDLSSDDNDQVKLWLQDLQWRLKTS